MKYRCSLVAISLLVSCTGPRPPLVVKQFQLRDQAPSASEEPSIKMEKERHLHGAVSLEERNKKLGQYYTLIWNEPNNLEQGPVKLIFQYQQAASASRVKQITRTFPSEQTSGQIELAITGDDYLKKGRVLTWKATLLRGKREVASRQSYLWR